MRTQHPIDDRQRVVHHLVRQTLGDQGTGAVEHLETDELAALIAGTLFKTECSRVENHLLSCATCQAAAAGLHADQEAGVVPILVRRADSVVARPTTFRERLTRRYSPLVAATLVFLLLAAVPFSLNRFLSAGEVRLDETVLVVRRFGTPVILADGDRSPAETGAWIDDVATLLMERGDRVRVLRSSGRLSWVTVDGMDEDGPVHALFAGLYQGALRSRDEIDRMAHRRAPPPQGPSGRPRILHPLGRLHDVRPPIRWTDANPVEAYEVVLVRRDDRREIFRREAGGRVLAYPADALSLEPGRAYTVWVGPRHGDAGSRSQPVEFQIVETKRWEEVGKALALLDRTVGKQASLLRAEYLRQSALLAEAREELEALRVDDGANVHLLALLKVMYRWMGLHEEEARLHRVLAKRESRWR